MAFDALKELLPASQRMPAWMPALCEHGLVQSLQWRHASACSTLWLFGGSPRWWKDAPAASKAPLVLLGLLHDASGKAHLFQLKAVGRLPALQAASLASAVRSCPSYGCRELRDIGTLRRVSHGETLLREASQSTSQELLALLHGSDVSLDKAQIALVKRCVTQALACLVRQFESKLDRRLLQPLISCPIQRYRHYNALMCMPREKRRNFAQACHAFPFVCAFMLGRDSVAQRIVQVIAQGQPLYPTLCALFTAPQWVFQGISRAYREQDLAKVCPPQNHTAVLSLIDAVARLNHNRLPATVSGWDYLLCAVDRLAVPHWIADLQRTGFDALASGAGLSRKMMPWRGKRGLNSQVAVIRDYLDYSGQADDQDFPPPLPSDGFWEIWDKARRWRRLAPADVLDHYWNANVPGWLQRPVQANPVQAGAPANDRSTWRAILPEAAVINEYEFHELTSALALKEEGHAMRHCVGGYAYQCLHHATHIFSIRRAGRRVATLEVKAAPLGQYRIVQIRGPRNADPASGVSVAAQAMVQRLHAKANSVRAFS